MSLTHDKPTGVFLCDPTLPCGVCGLPSEWTAFGVSGCQSRCGAVTPQDVARAESAVRSYRSQLEVLAVVRQRYRDVHPGPGCPPPRSPRPRR